MDEDKCILKFGYHLSLCLSVDTAFKIFKLLSEENLMTQESSYKGGKTVFALKPWGSDEITLSLLSKTEYMLRIAAGEPSNE